jgi:hypothetical protein
MEGKLRCNICNEIIETVEVGQHITGRNHAVKRKVAEFHEMNAQVGNNNNSSSNRRNNYDGDTSVVNMWIKGLYSRDFLSLG